MDTGLNTWPKTEYFRYQLDHSQNWSDATKQRGIMKWNLKWICDYLQYDKYKYK